jgi:hypothetical protein
LYTYRTSPEQSNESGPSHAPPYRPRPLDRVKHTVTHIDLEEVRLDHETLRLVPMGDLLAKYVEGDAISG